VSIWHPPPSIAAYNAWAGPGHRVADYGWFVGQMIDRYGHVFGDIELWSDPHALYLPDRRQCESCWSMLGDSIAGAAEVARHQGKRAVLGVAMPGDQEWLALLRAHGALAEVDVVALRGAPEMWWESAPRCDQQRRWHGWDEHLAGVRERCAGKPIWVTETGLATWDARAERTGRYRLQAELLRQAARAPAERVYWHCLLDPNPTMYPTRDHARRDHARQVDHLDEHAYHQGLVSWAGARKPAWGIMKHLLADESTPLVAPPAPASAVTWRRA
jgi:hypothetical protein